MQLTHTVLVVSDFSACFRFYRDVLEFQVAAGEEAGPFAVFASGTAMLGLFDDAARPDVLRRQSESRGRPGPPRFTLAVLVEDVDETFRRLSAKGVRYTLEPHDFPSWGFRSSLCQDPAGNPIEIYCPLPGSGSA
jgi:catechol 2,3-dioxygenase-like lactoylglutathione lyase family enzyme